ncbi:MAG: tRNA (adenosine(37)-N6)-threonylcarbamoyltransferase complex ATPase subunit type 1 TsaE [bacterium]|nr:tRNA (adenosine(37)-N6)-threonylcarbamoyltransferase complex ATPase subunit type 1 TsaE [bacterium]
MNSDLQLVLQSPEELPEAAASLLNFAGSTRTLLFEAPMGAGKTTLIKALCVALGSNDNFSSPTYSIINEYKFANEKIYHIDLYRLNLTEELLDLGVEEYLNSGNYCFVEWPSLMREVVEGPFVEVSIRVEENIRYIRATKKRN